MPESIKAKFIVTKNAVTIYVHFHKAACVLRWPREDRAISHIQTLAANLPEVIRDGLNEVFVTDQANRLDFEISELFTDEDERDGK